MPSPLDDLVAAARACIREIDVAAVARGTPGNRVLIDVREPDEYAAGHLPGAVNLPRGVLEFRIQAHPAVAGRTAAAPVRLEHPIVLYCLTGGRAALAAASLQRLGFTRVSSLAGGIAAWKQAGKPITTEA